MKILRLMLLFTLVYTGSAVGCHMVVRFEHYPPQSYIDENKQWQGMDVEFAEALLTEAGCTYQFERIPWGRAVKLMENGKIDMMLSVSKNPDREAFMRFIGPQRSEQVVLVSLATQPITLDKFYSLKTYGKPVAIQQGAFYGKRFEQLLAQDKDNVESHFIVISDNEAKLSLLSKGRVSGVVEERLNILYQIRNNPLFNNVVLYPVVIHSNPVYFAFSRASVSAEMIEKLEVAYQHLKASNALTKIELKHDEG